MQRPVILVVFYFSKGTETSETLVSFVQSFLNMHEREPEAGAKILYEYMKPSI